MSERKPTLDSVCPLCGMPIPFKQAELIEADMENDQKTCIRCAMTFAEVRKAIADGVDP